MTNTKQTYIPTSLISGLIGLAVGIVVGGQCGRNSGLKVGNVEGRTLGRAQGMARAQVTTIEERDYNKDGTNELEVVQSDGTIRKFVRMPFESNSQIYWPLEKAQQLETERLQSLYEARQRVIESEKGRELVKLAGDYDAAQVALAKRYNPIRNPIKTNEAAIR